MQHGWLFAMIFNDDFQTVRAQPSHHYWMAFGVPWQFWMIIQKLFCMTIQMWAEALDAKLNVEEVLDVHPKFGLKFWMFIQNLGQLEAEMNAGRHG